MENNLEIVDLFLSDERVYQNWQSLLRQEEIVRVEREQTQMLDTVIGIYDQAQLVATASAEQNILKYFAILPDYRMSGKTFNRLISTLFQKKALVGMYHLMVITKNTYEKSFSSVGFKLLAHTAVGCILEYGTPAIQDFIAKLPQFPNQQKAAIVMNANPFTKGHHALIQKASIENDQVYVFLLEKEQAYFTTQERLALVQKGTAEFSNVHVILGGEYIISATTFPTYFLKVTDTAAAFQMELDAKLFGASIAKPLKITRRYVGEEPDSELTRLYNETLKSCLKPTVEVIEIPRISTADQQTISASAVRKAWLEGKVEEVASFLPTTTYQFLKDKEPKERDIKKDENRKNGDSWNS